MVGTRAPQPAPGAGAAVTQPRRSLGGCPNPPSCPNRVPSGCCARRASTWNGSPRSRPTGSSRTGRSWWTCAPRSSVRTHPGIPGSLVIDLTVLPWRLHPEFPWRIPEAVSADQRWILVCRHGYSTSVAAWTLQRMGLTAVTDVIGGFEAWQAAGLPTTVDAPDVRQSGPRRSVEPPSWRRHEKGAPVQPAGHPSLWPPLRTRRAAGGQPRTEREISWSRARTSMLRPTLIFTTPARVHSSISALKSRVPAFSVDHMLMLE